MEHFTSLYGPSHLWSNGNNNSVAIHLKWQYCKETQLSFFTDLTKANGVYTTVYDLHSLESFNRLFHKGLQISLKRKRVTDVTKYHLIASVSRFNNDQSEPSGKIVDVLFSGGYVEHFVYAFYPLVALPTNALVTFQLVKTNQVVPQQYCLPLNYVISVDNWLVPLWANQIIEKSTNCSLVKENVGFSYMLTGTELLYDHYLQFANFDMRFKSSSVTYHTPLKPHRLFKDCDIKDTVISAAPKKRLAEEGYIKLKLEYSDPGLPMCPVCQCATCELMLVGCGHCLCRGCLFAQQIKVCYVCRREVSMFHRIYF
ncbi:hypothetical protein [Scale drop disease virus]|uniref:ORF_120L n=1 Tax=Scale drop disease virus TaxID=1697349 RepID=A0A0K1L7B2_9VIRU|nr:ORF_120L [Scale drop disease virus]AKU37535.1 ORF_120L [Scale drop disease virus]QLI60656.1 hypothetical protein [Scale drop disease virus]QXJ13573.1 ORF120L [Scale drop disease virus]UNH60799.1 hypothetical protein SDDV_ORF130 [Scale drop disease virus]